MTWIAWALLSAFFAGVTAVLAKIGVEGVDSSLATAIRTMVVLVFTWAIALTVAPRGMLATLSRHTWLFLTLSGIATGLSWLCYFRAIQLGPVSRVALILRERLTWQHAAGGTLIVAGALILAWKAA